MVIVTVGRDWRGLAMVVSAVIGMSGRSTGLIVTRDLGGRVGGMVVMTVSGVMAVARIVAVIVVRLVLVAHRDSVPQPLFAVFAAKSV